MIGENKALAVEAGAVKAAVKIMTRHTGNPGWLNNLVAGFLEKL